MSDARRFRRAYLTSLLASAGASALTIIYVGSGVVPEANPVTAGLIETMGMGGAVATRTLLVIGLYWAYWVVGEVSGAQQAAILFGWLGALVNGLDLAGNLYAATVIGTVPTTGAQTDMLALLGALAVAALLARPAQHYGHVTRHDTPLINQIDTGVNE